jgi:hypothetical protein
LKKSHESLTGKREPKLSDGAAQPAPLSVTLTGKFADRGGKVQRLLLGHLAEIGRSGHHKVILMATTPSKKQGQEPVTLWESPSLPTGAIFGLAVCHDGRSVIKVAIIPANS